MPETTFAEEMERLNKIADAIADAAGDRGVLPLRVRYGAAVAALKVVGEWERLREGGA